MDGLGFRPQSGRRVAVRNEQGAKVGYLSSVNGRQVYQSTQGEVIAYITNWKYSIAPSRQGAQGGTIMPEDKWSE